jgi:hypothetical protein
LIGKEEAINYLSLNKKNRPLRQVIVDNYALEMKRGNWRKNTGEGIKFCKKGFLIDGQHRLSAILQSDKKFNMLVIYDIEENVFDVLDTGKNRGASDVFALSEIPNYAQTSTIVKEYISFSESRFYKTTAREILDLSNSGLLKKYNENPNRFNENTKLAQKFSNKLNRVMSVTNIGSFLLMFSYKNENEAIDFFERLCGIKHNDVIVIDLLLDFLIKDKISNKKSSTNLKYAYIIKTWNAYRLKKELKLLKFDDTKEEFPIIL